GTGVFDDAIASLTPDTTYYVRAWAENADGFAYGDEVSFETLPQVFAISGVCTLNGAPVEGAIIACFKSDDLSLAGFEASESDGTYIVEDLDEAETYTVFAVYATEDADYTALLQW